MSAPAHEHGSLADEAARLLDAFGQVAGGWSRAATERADDGRRTDDGRRADNGQRADDGQRADGPSPTACRVCPWCQVVARVQESRPEVVAHLADAATSLAAALAELAGAREPATTDRPAREDIEHIDIGD